MRGKYLGVLSAGVLLSALAAARHRLGEPPLENLFHLSAAHWAPPSAEAHAFHGLSLYGLDGTTLCSQ